MKEHIQATDATFVPYQFSNGFAFNLQRSGTRFHPFILKNSDITVLVNRRQADGLVPTVCLEIGSASCWAPGYDEVYSRFKRWLEVLGGSFKKEVVSEVHLCADFIGQELAQLGVTNKDRWINKAHKFSVHHDRTHIEGVSIGKGNIMLRIYDKVRELSKQSPHKIPVFEEVWSLYPYDSSPVTRVEFQLRRDVLKEFQDEIVTYDDLINARQSIWNYCVNNWARFTASPVNRNHNQSKSTNAVFWDLVTGVYWGGKSDVIRCKRFANKHYYSMLDQFRGLAMSIASFFEIDPTDIDQITDVATDCLKGNLNYVFAQDEYEFIKKMVSKRNALFLHV